MITVGTDLVAARASDVGVASSASAARSRSWANYERA